MRHSVGLHQPTNDVTHCNTLQHIATHCNTLQHTATHCNTMPHTATHIEDTASHASLLSCEWGNTLQHTATHCNTLQHTLKIRHPLRLHHPVAYTYMYMFCAYTLCVCVCVKRVLWNMTFSKKIFAWCYWSVCCMVLQCVVEDCCKRLQLFDDMVVGWQRWVGYLQYHVSLVEKLYKNRAHLKKRPRNLGSLKTIATIILDGSITMCIAVCCRVLQCVALCCSVL